MYSTQAQHSLYNVQSRYRIKADSKESIQMNKNKFQLQTGTFSTQLHKVNTQTNSTETLRH